MNIFGYIPNDLNNGEGIRLTIFISGCTHNCKGCHAQDSHNFHYGRKFTEEMQDELINMVYDDILYDGITLSGGDPLQSYEDVYDFLKKFKSNTKRKLNVWVYTGYEYDEIQNLIEIKGKNILKYIDVLVTGEFKEELKDPSLKFMGSSNQSIIHIDPTTFK